MRRVWGAVAGGGGMWQGDDREAPRAGQLKEQQQQNTNNMTKNITRALKSELSLTI